MEKEFIITSTNTIEGVKISKYYGVINNNVVVGTNLFSDIGASFLDIFGGNSSSYQKKLSKIYDTSVQNLKVKARDLGANAILGLSIDFDEISGGNKSMFMISASGTAVLINHSEIKEESDNKIIDLVSNDLLESELTKKRIFNQIENKKSLTQEDWYFLQRNPNSTISEKLLNNFIESYGYTVTIGSDQGNTLLNNIANYFRLINQNDSIETLYSKLIENSPKIFDIIIINKLFSPIKVIEFINNGEINIAIKCLEINKKNYSKDDLDKMNKIIEIFDSLEDKGSIKKSKSLIGKEKEKYVCSNGHTNDIENEYCQTFNCLQNIKGLTKEQVEKINNFKIKVKTLNDLFNKN